MQTFKTNVTDRRSKWELELRGSDRREPSAQIPGEVGEGREEQRVCECQTSGSSVAFHGVGPALDPSCMLYDRLIPEA